MTTLYWSRSVLDSTAPRLYQYQVPKFECGFSEQSILKSKLRNRLNPERLDRLKGPDGNADYKSAARTVGSLKGRQR